MQLVKKLGSIKGIVTNANSRPIEEANVVIDQGPSHADLAAVTGADGSFSFGGLSPGKYLIKAFSGGLASDSIEVPVVRGKTAFVEITFEQNGAKEVDVVDEIE